MNNSCIYDSLQDTESDASDCIDPPKRRNVSRIVSESEESQDDEEEDPEGTKNPNTSEEWKDVTEKADLPFSFAFKTSPRTVEPQISRDVKKPLDFFKLYFTDILIDQIAKETNKKEDQRETVG